MNNGFVIRGDLCYCTSDGELHTLPGGYLVCENGASQGTFQQLPERYADWPLRDYAGMLVIPGLVDLHIHAPQYAYRGLGMDLELLDWLNIQTFPQEARYRDTAYADRAYTAFVEELCKGPNTRACVFATLHRESTLLLMDKLEASGLVTMVGKVNMDRNSPPELRETAEESARETVAWLEAAAGRYQRTSPILTPRFIPSCSDELMRELQAIQRQYQLPVQSHLSENQGEIQWVRELCPEAAFYGDAYDRFGLFGNGVPTVMAHCTWSGEEERRRMKDNGVLVAHCPQSNTNLSSGIAPVRTFLDEGLQVGLGSDVAGGCHSSIFRAMADAIQVSKLRWRLVDDTKKALTMREAFYLGTVGGGRFFGRVGSFEAGFELDAVVLDDAALAPPFELSLEQRLERAIYLSDDRQVHAKYVRGTQLSPA